MRTAKHSNVLSRKSPLEIFDKVRVRFSFTHMCHSLNQYIFVGNVRNHFRIRILLLKVHSLPFIHHRSLTEEVIVDSKLIQAFQRSKSALLLKHRSLGEVENALRPERIAMVNRHEIVLDFVYSLGHFLLCSVVTQRKFPLLLVKCRYAMI